jgi:hypothetical protein
MKRYEAIEQLATRPINVMRFNNVGLNRTSKTFLQKLKNLGWACDAGNLEWSAVNLDFYTKNSNLQSCIAAADNAEQNDNQKQKSPRFIVISLVITTAQPNRHTLDTQAHANILVWDTKTHVVERYDPHGECTEEMFEPERMDNSLTIMARNFGYTYVGNVGPSLGLQTFEHADDQLIQSTFANELKDQLSDLDLKTEGFCVSFTLFYLYMRLSPDWRDLSSSEAQFELNLLMHSAGENISVYISRFTAFLTSVDQLKPFVRLSGIPDPRSRSHISSYKLRTFKNIPKSGMRITNRVPRPLFFVENPTLNYRAALAEMHNKIARSKTSSGTNYQKTKTRAIYMEYLLRWITAFKTGKISRESVLVGIGSLKSQVARQLGNIREYSTLETLMDLTNNDAVIVMLGLTRDISAYDILERATLMSAEGTGKSSDIFGVDMFEPESDIYLNRRPFTSFAMTRKVSPREAMTKRVSPRRAMTKRVSPHKAMTKRVSPRRAMIKRVSPRRAKIERVSVLRSPRR